MSRQEQELDAAEYVIGTLSGVERRVFEDLMATNKQTQEDVWYWEQAFGALNASISPDAPPEAMWERIDGSLPAKNGSRRLPNLLKPKKVKDTRQIESKQPEVPLVEDEPAVSSVSDLVEEETVEEPELKKSKFWPDKSSEPTPDPDAVVVVEETKIPEPAPKILAPVPEEAPHKVEEKTPTKINESSAHLVETPGKDLARKLRLWRIIALLAIICLLGPLWWIFSQRNSAPVVTNEPLSTGQKAKQYLAVVNANGDQPSLVVQIDSANGTMKINPIGILIPTGKSLQLWYRPKDGERIAVGLLSYEVKDFRIAGVEQGGVLEISVEPAGGSQNDQPSGPVVYSGALEEMGPN